MSKNEYEKLFDDFLDLTEFTLIQYFDGWGLKDNQGGNLGGIESRRFTDAAELLDNMDMYIEDYLVEPIEDCLGIDFGEDGCWGTTAAKHLDDAGDSTDDVLMLDAICNHPDEIVLKNCKHETASEKIFTIICNNCFVMTSVISFRNIKDARDYVKLELNAIKAELLMEGHTEDRIVHKEYEYSSGLFVPNTDIYYEWQIKESMLF